MSTFFSSHNLCLSSSVLHTFSGGPTCLYAFFFLLLSSSTFQRCQLTAQHNIVLAALSYRQSRPHFRRCHSGFVPHCPGFSRATATMSSMRTTSGRNFLVQRVHQLLIPHSEPGTSDQLCCSAITCETHRLHLRNVLRVVFSSITGENSHRAALPAILIPNLKLWAEEHLSPLFTKSLQQE